MKLKDTLVLNRNYQPITIVKWNRAVRLWIKQKAEVINHYDIELIPGRLWKPSVIVLKNFVKPPKKGDIVYLPYSRENIYLRDNGMCQYCRKPVTKTAMTLDHITPRAQGGKTSWKNVVCSCNKCNEKKADKAPEEAKMKLIAVPFIPIMENRQHLFMAKLRRIKDRVPHKSWSDYIY